jgi:phage gp29-like protein
MLVDRFGDKIDTGRLLEEAAGPTLTGVRSIMSTHPGRGLTPERLVDILQAAEDGDPEEYLALAQDMEERETHYAAQLQTRKLAVAQLDPYVEAASDSADDVRAADLVRSWLRSVELEDILLDALDAIGPGFSVLEIKWDRSGREWIPVDLEHRDPRWFAFDRESGRKLLIRDDAGLRPLAPYKFVTHFHRARSGLPIRGGLARLVAWCYLFKLYALRDWVQFVELFGQPYRIGTYGPGASELDKMTLLRAVSQIGTDAAAIVPESMKIEFKEAARNGAVDTFRGLVEFLDSQVSKAVLGQTLTSDVSSAGGSRALGDVHNQVRKDIMRSDARQVAGALNKMLVRPLVDLNLGSRAEYPIIRLGLPDSLSTREKVQLVRQLVPFGLQVEESVARDWLGIPDPPKDSVVLRAPARQGAPEPEPAAQTQGGGRTAAHAAPPAVGAPTDPGELARAALEDSGWEQIVEPMVDPVRKLLADVDSLEEFRERLAELVVEIPTHQLAELLGRNLFAARLAGELEPTGAEG